MTAICSARLRGHSRVNVFLLLSLISLRTRAAWSPEGLTASRGRAEEHLLAPYPSVMPHSDIGAEKSCFLGNLLKSRPNAGCRRLLGPRLPHTLFHL